MQRTLLCLITTFAVSFGEFAHGQAGDWPHVGGASGGGHFTPHEQITRDNLDDLEIAWVHRSGDFREGGNFKDGNNYPAEPLQTALQVTPILFNSTLYYCTPYNRVFALNPNTGAGCRAAAASVPGRAAKYRGGKPATCALSRRLWMPGSLPWMQ
jgi:quinoprotein glucose dehydrogenase